MSKSKILVGIIVLGAISFGGYKLFSEKKETVVYTTEDVSRENLKQTVSATGEVTSSQEVELAFQLTGKVESVLADIGDKVVRGQKLATIDRSTFPQQLRQAEMDIRIQKRTLDNMEHHNDSYSKEQRSAQKATVKKAQAAYDAVLRQMRDNALYAPMDGTITKRTIDPGEIIMSGNVAFVIANPEDLLLESNIPEVDIVDISLDQEVAVTFDALSEEEVFMGKVSSIDPAATVIQDVVYYRIKIKLENFDRHLKIGMTCNDDIITASAENVLMIPQRAVKKENGKKYVELLEKKEDNDEVKRVYVETGISGDNGMIEIKSNLKEGDRVITFTKV